MCRPNTRIAAPDDADNTAAGSTKQRDSFFARFTAKKSAYAKVQTVDIEANEIKETPALDVAPPPKRTKLNLGWIVALNVLLAFAEIVVGTSIRSLALVSDGAHNFSDAASAFVAMLAESYDKRDYDRERLPFGYARATTVGALVNVAALEALCLSIALSALCKFYRPDAVSDLRALLIVSAVGAVVNIASALMACCGVEGAHVHVGGGVCDGNHAPVAGAGRWASIGRMACADGCCAAAPPPPPLQTLAFQAPMQRGAKRPPSFRGLPSAGDGGGVTCLPCVPCAPPSPEPEADAAAPAPRLDVGRLAIVLHHVGDAAGCLLVLGEALLLQHGGRALPSRVMRGLGLYLDPALSLFLSLAIGAAAWPVGVRAAWTLLEGAPPPDDKGALRDQLQAALKGRAKVESTALVHLRDPLERCAMVRLEVGDDKAAASAARAGIRIESVADAARRVLRRFGATRHVYVEVNAERGFPRGASVV